MSINCDREGLTNVFFSSTKSKSRHLSSISKDWKSKFGENPQFVCPAILADLKDHF